MEYGIQMYSLRDITDKDLDGALRAVAEMGYKTVEFAGFFGHSAEEVRAMLDKYGLVCSGNHNYIIPGHDLSTKAKLDEFIAQCNEIAPKLREKGIELGYHNHSHEFIPTAEGYEIHKELEERCDVFFELDTYWSFVAKRDPVSEMERLKSRLRCIHLKDGSPDGKGCSLGQGAAPVKAVRKKAIELGVGIVVESEGLDPTGKEEVERCINFLKACDAEDAE